MYHSLKDLGIVLSSVIALSSFYYCVHILQKTDLFSPCFIFSTAFFFFKYFQRSTEMTKLGPDLSPHLVPSPDSPPAMKKIQSPMVLRCIFLPLSCLLITVSFSNDSWSVWLSLLVQERKPSGNKILNEEYVAYKQQDCALASWLLASISPSILPGLVRCKSSFDIWQKLEQMYSISSTTRIMHLYCSLKSLRKRDHTMREYLDQIQAIYDNLAICGHTLSETVHISTILSGLPLEYESVVAVITSSQQPYKLDGVCSVLLDTEARQQDQLSQSIFSVNLAQGQIQSPGSILCQRQNFNSLSPSTQLVEGNTAIVQGQSSFSSPSVVQNQGVQQGSYHQGSNQNNNSSYQQSRTSTPPYRGRGGRGHGGCSRHQCQLCGKIGHLVNRCYYRFDVI
ncbi:hypothetical protein F3Y22_tig00110893pilonHSYRG00288 [Hibiscus syriacus]|uniref:CCHC-type domain-containing protein n=1 Tax=Hibiscus syriacus TaxID=106335 RepID=A0A6A2ZFN8_HIBSY|nr:hypothetical protein F3Y22_tig00110893pilonHSYRG00288 [Hibiscus syriacus]